jgi:hypothetical protein
VPPGVSTVGAAPTSQTSQGAAAKTTAAGAAPTGTSSGAGSTSTSTPKSNVGATVGHNFALAIGGMVFAGTLLFAVLL